MINTIEIENITVFEKIEIIFCKGINIFIGENGTGKTHLLKIIYSETHESEKKIDPDIFFGGMIIRNFNEHKQKKVKVNTSSYNHKKNIGVFIPANEMLSHSRGLLVMAEKYSREMPFDKTQLDILKKAQAWIPDDIPILAKNIIPKLEKVIDGKVLMRNDNSFWVRKNNGLEILFSMEAEGLRKFGLLWQLLMNESITEGTILLWDEPEANLNPQLLPVLVDILLELSRSGVQIFLATHSGNLCEYFDIKKAESGDVMYHFLSKSDTNVKCHSIEKYNGAEDNPIELASERLYEDTLDSAFGEVQDDE